MELMSQNKHQFLKTIKETTYSTMKVLFVLAVALVQGLAVSANNVQVSHFPAQIQISNLPADIEISNLPSEIEAHNDIEISNLPSEIEGHGGIEISHLPAEIELPNGIEISHLPAEIELPGGIEISHLPAELPESEVEATPDCVKYVRALLEEVLQSLPGGQGPVEQPDIDPQPPTPVEENACTLCFQKIQLLIEKANSRNSLALTNF